MDGVSRFARSLRRFDRRISASAVGGALLLPFLQASTYRLEMLAHAIVATCDGKKAPRQRDLATWLTDAGKIVGHHEDPAEDVFAGRVVFEGRNYRVLEGLSEGGVHHLQLLVQVLEGMPTRFQELKDACRAMLAVSEALCARAEILPFVLGAENPVRQRVSPSTLPQIRTLRQLTTFSKDDLHAIGVRYHFLEDFTLPTSTQDVLAGYTGASALARRPILAFAGELVVALPTAIGPAIRSAVIETCLSLGAAATQALRVTHLTAQTNRLCVTPMIDSIGLSPTPLKLSPVIPSEAVEIEPGYWIQVILTDDDLSGFEDGGIVGAAGNSAQVERALHQAIEVARNKCKAAPGFKVGLTYVIICGFGRGQMLGLRDHGENWFVEAASAYDAEVLGWRSDFSLTDLLRLAMVKRELTSIGFEIRHMNGLLAQVGGALSNRGHLIPHEALPDGISGGVIMGPINAQLSMRIEHHRRFDLCAIPSPDGTVVNMRRDGGGTRSPGGVSRIYFSVEEVVRGRKRAAWVKGDRTWWIETRPRSNEPQGSLLGALEAQRAWMERIAPILDEALPELPDVLLWDLRIDPQPPTRSAELVPASLDEIKGAIEVLHDCDAGTITTVVGQDFWRGLSNPDNIAEATLVHSVVVGALRLLGRPEEEATSLTGRVVRSPSARQLHTFAPQDFRDHMRDAFDRRVVQVSSLQDGAIRIGLGWSGVGRPGGTVRGVSECTRALNAITAAAEEALCRDLARFDRRGLIEAAVRNHEAAAIDSRRWNRTAGAIIGLADDEESVRAEVAESIFRLNGVSLACRLLMEIGLHHCPSHGGLLVADIDLSRLMARALMVVHLGGYSDAIRYGAMKPEIRISPAGEVQIHLDFFDNVMDPVGRDFSDLQIDRVRLAYADYLTEPDLLDKPEDETLTAKFEAAWTAELGASFWAFRDVMDELENICIQRGRAWVVMPRGELLAHLEAKITDAATVVGELESIPRHGWKQVPPTFFDSDRQPWRFQRRLSIARRSLIRLGAGEDAEILVAPGIVREGFGSTVDSMYEGNYEVSRLTSREMRRWAGELAKERGERFEKEVAAQLRELGWFVRTGVKFGAVLGRDRENDPGDIDVLAWRVDGRIMLLECKRLKFAKTPSEVAKQLSEFRGAYDAAGKPDRLARHLNRWRIAQDNVAAFAAFTGLAPSTLEAGLVFSNTVPMQFALNKMSEKLWVGTLSDLGSM